MSEEYYQTAGVSEIIYSLVHGKRLGKWVEIRFVLCEFVEANLL